MFLTSSPASSFFGVGLDDAFIITGSFFRLDSRKDPIERVAETIDDVGISIFSTTLTSALAFSFGAISSVPGVFWLVAYAAPTMLLILLWQLSFFVACIVLDEHRVQLNNSDCFRCIRAESPVIANETAPNTNTVSSIDKFMESYARVLLKPVVKVIVIVGFIALAVLCTLSTLNLKQAFTFTDVLPSDSYITPFFDSLTKFSDQITFPYIFFRGVDQSNPDIRLQMDNFINEISNTTVFNGQPERCWLRDFEEFIAQATMVDEPFNVQLEAFLQDEVYYALYQSHIVLDPDGNITASRCQTVMKDLDFEDVKSQISALKSQEGISLRQPANFEQEELKLFTYDQNYNIFEFFTRSPREVSTCGTVSIISPYKRLCEDHFLDAFFYHCCHSSSYFARSTLDSGVFRSPFHFCSVQRPSWGDAMGGD